VKTTALVLLLLTTPLFGQIHFDPPDPTPRTAVLARIHIPGAGCGLTGAIVNRNGSIISISLQYSDIQCFAAEPADLVADLGIVPAGVYDVVVSPGILLSALAEAELDVHDANPPFEVRPNTRGSGSEVVHLTGKGLVGCSTSLSPIVCEEITVHFGTTAAEVVSKTPDEIVVRQPGPTPGTFDVTIEKPAVTLRATAAYHVPKPTGLNEAFYERTLLPVFWSGPGAFGAQWQTTASLYNANEYTLTSAHSSVLHSVCVIANCDPRPLPNSTTTASADSSLIAGVVEELSRQAMEKIDLGLIIRDTSRSAQDLGTEIPVVRQPQLYARTFSIPNVPNDPRYRLTLRLYSIESATVFGLRIYTNASSNPVVTKSIALTADAGLRNGGFVVINDLFTAYPEIGAFGPLRVEIDPGIRDGYKSAWGFITVTNNDTQHVTVLSPQ
jgi:hypothetical protein